MQGLAASEASNSNGADQIVPAGMPIPGVAADAATESVSFSGSNSSVGMFGMSTDELEQRMREGRERPAASEADQVAEDQAVPRAAVAASAAVSEASAEEEDGAAR